MRGICIEKNRTVSWLATEKIAFPPKPDNRHTYRRTYICFYRVALLLKSIERRSSDKESTSKKATTTLMAHHLPRSMNYAGPHSYGALTLKGFTNLTKYWHQKHILSKQNFMFDFQYEEYNPKTDYNKVLKN